jgi:hypothetical protein
VRIRRALVPLIARDAAVIEQQLSSGVVKSAAQGLSATSGEEVFALGSLHEAVEGGTEGGRDRTRSTYTRAPRARPKMPLRAGEKGS